MRRRDAATHRVRYGTWIRPRRIALFWGLAVVFAGLSALSALSPWFLLSLAPATLLGYIAVVITWTHLRLSSAGGGYQSRIHELLLTHLPETSEVLDVGCGNGSLILKVAKRYPEARCVGMDHWGSNWEYSLHQCQVNAREEGVPNATFLPGNAARISLADNSFGAVLSCLTFHEVQQEPDKTKVMQEALRVLRPGGRFIFMDLFDDSRSFPPHRALLEAIGGANCRVETDEPLASLMPLPYPLNTGKALRYARVLAGTKNGGA